MRRPRGQGTKRADGRWMVRVSITGPNGIKKSVAVYGKTQTEAKAAAERVRKTGSAYLTGAITLSALRESWKAVAWDRLKPKSRISDETAWNKVNEVWGDVKIKSIQRARLSDWLNSLDHRRTAEIIKSRLNQYFKHAIDREWLKESPAEGIELRVAQSKTKHYKLSAEEVEQIIVADSPYRLFWSVLATTGLRPWDEAAVLQRDNLHRAEGSWWLHIEDSKTSSGVRVVPLPEWLGAELSKVKNGPLFLNRDGKTQLDQDAGYYEWKKLLKSLGVRHTRPYELRHYTNRMLLLEGVDEIVRMRQMGHKNPNLSLTVYADLTLEDQRKLLASRGVSKKVSK